MTFATFETSATQGQPEELYEFRRGVSVWRYTSAQADQALGVDVYTAAPMQRATIKQTGDLNQQRLDLTCARDIAIAAEFISTPPSEVTLLTVRRRHGTDTDYAVVWMGRVLGAQWADQASVVLHCEPVSTSLKRTGLRRLYQRNCPHVLYGVPCGASTAAVQFIGAASVINANAVTVPGASAKPDGWYTGGYASWNASGASVRRMITGHVGDTLTLSAAPLDLAVGMAVTLLPGCDHTLGTCDAKFANSANYGGFPFIPTSNPLGGATVF